MHELVVIPSSLAGPSAAVANGKDCNNPGIPPANPAMTQSKPIHGQIPPRSLRYPTTRCGAPCSPTVSWASRLYGHVRPLREPPPSAALHSSDIGTSKQTTPGWELVMARIVLREKTAEDPGEWVRRKPPLSTFGRVLAMMLAFVGTVVFAVVLARLTLEPSAASVPLTHNNLRPGDSIRAYLAHPMAPDTVKQLGGNIVMGIPFGVLLPVLVPRTRGLVRVAAATALVMILVELVQGALITGRAFDVDDVLLNTAGALMGYLLIGRRMGRAVHPRRRPWWHRFTKRQPTAEDPA
ncbi:hypothetical protein GCM10018773_64150 [Streptomyces candidus]|nr:hypothetical protein GCM10018773_64150 [Streptomyces candidus]